MKKPPSLVWLPADHRLLGSGSHAMPFLVLGEKYARAVKEHVAAQPVLFPLAQGQDIASLLEVVDGVMLTGSPSNVHPARFGATVFDPALPLDPARDSLTLALVQACLQAALPLLGVCRGFQEINVALGGSLHQQVHAQHGFLDHREDKSASYDVQYGQAHPVTIEAESAMAVWAGGTTAMVNSVHGQGVDRLAPGLHAIAHAPDGLVEAFEVEGARAFAYAVQWHPEWKPAENHFYRAIFTAFGDACRKRHDQRLSA